MRNILSIILTTAIFNVYGVAEVETHLPFNEAFLEEIRNGERAKSTCLVIGENMYGSGVLFALDGKVGVLTAAHIPNPKAVHFFILNNRVNPPRPENLKCDVLNATPMESDLKRLTAQTDMQVLSVSGKPEEYVRPLELSSEIDESTLLSVYGFGTICAEFSQGRLSIALPTHGGAPLPSKVNVPTFTIDPKTSPVNYAFNGFVRILHRIGMFPYLIQTEINPKSSRVEGLIRVTTQYEPTSLQTHIGQGFSGGPALQGNNVVGICQSASLNITNRTTPETIKLWQAQVLAMWSSYILGIKLPMLQSVAPWLFDPILSPTFRFALEKCGVKWLSTPLRMCAFNSGVFLLSALGIKAYTAYTNSNYAVLQPKQAFFVRLTTEAIDWIKTVLNNKPTH